MRETASPPGDPPDAGSFASGPTVDATWAQAYESLAAARREHEAAYHQLAHAYHALREDYEEVRRERDELREHVRDRERDRQREQAVHDAQQDGRLVDQDRNAHRGHIQRYDHLVEQSVVPVAAELWRIPGKDLERTRHEALAIARLTRLLFCDHAVVTRLRQFGADPAVRQSVRGTILAALRTPEPGWPDWLHRNVLRRDANSSPKLDQLLEQVAAFHADVGANRYPVTFVMPAPATLSVPDSARRWSLSPVEGRVVFVVAPGYVVAGGPAVPPAVWLGPGRVS